MIPRPKAWWTMRRVASASMLEPRVSQVPSAISLTSSSLLPSLRYCTRAFYRYAAQVFELTRETDAAWAPRVVAELPELLVDHAHCEKKAAGMAVNLIFRYPDHGFLLEPLSRLAREELAHFEEVLRMMASRGIAFRAQKPAPYAGRLRKETRTYEPARLLDTLLCCALIEARSCERFELLAQAAPEPDDSRCGLYEPAQRCRSQRVGSKTRNRHRARPRFSIAPHRNAIRQ